MREEVGVSGTSVCVGGRLDMSVVQSPLSPVRCGGRNLEYCSGSGFLSG